MALNAPLFLIVLYLLPLVAIGTMACLAFCNWDQPKAGRWIAGYMLALLLLGAGLALLGAAYLHDVWYC